MNPQGSNQNRIAPVNISPEQFRSAGHELIERIADLLGSMHDRPVNSGLSVSEIRKLVNGESPLPLEGCDLNQLLSETTELLTQYSLYNGHPKFLGYVTSPPAPIGMLADLLAAAVNPNVGSWMLAPVATEIESQTIRWIAELLAFPKTCGGILVSGGNTANYVGLYAALRSVFPRDASSRNPEQLARATVYASSETHTWLEKAMDMFGLPFAARRTIKVDEAQRLMLTDLESQLAADLKAGHIPVAVVGSAGSVSTGAVDPLPAMADLCQRTRVWLHVDGAYGGFAAMLPNAPADLRGLAEADSVAIDPHKWLYAPLEAGCALVRDPERLRAAYSYRPPYYHFGVEATNFVDLGPQNSRGFRALKVWLGLKQVGRRGYERMIADDIALARELFARLEADPDFEALTCSLSIATFRYVPQEYRGRTDEPAVELYLNELNQALQARLEVSGEVFVSNAVLADRYVLRACIVNFRTSSKDIAEIPGIISRHGEQVHRDLASTRGGLKDDKL